MIIIGSDTFWRNSWKYRARAYRHSFWDAGTILANLLAAAHARTLPAHLTLGFADAPVNALLDVDTDREVALFLVGLGTGAALPPAAPPMEPLHLEVAPLSPEELDYPAIRIMHAASSLESPDDAAEWRGAAPETPFPPATGELFPLCPDTVDSLPSAALEDVIRRRGSTRRFSHQPLSLAQLSNVLVQATQPIPADCLAPSGRRLNDLYLIVNAVDGLPSGAYVFHPQPRPWSYYVLAIFVGRLANSRSGKSWLPMPAWRSSVSAMCWRYSSASAIGAIGWRNWKGEYWAVVCISQPMRRALGPLD